MAACLDLTLNCKYLPMTELVPLIELLYLRLQFYQLFFSKK